MARIRDRTEDFKDAVHRTALSLGYNESKLAAILASFIMHKPRQRSSFTKAALKTLESTETLDQFLMKHKKDYIDLHRTTEQERDSIEHEVTIFVKACKEQIDILKTSINDEESNSKGWLGIKGDHSNVDTIAHKHGVVLILSERLHTVTSQFDQLRAIRFQEAINRATPRRKLKRVAASDSTDNSKSNTLKLKEPDNSELREPDEVQYDTVKVQQQLLDDETRALQVELTNLLDAVQETETKMVEMSALNHLMSTHVLQQAQQIEFLYEQSCPSSAIFDSNSGEVSNPAYAQGLCIDAHLVSCITATLSPAIFTSVFHYKTSCEAWTALQSRFTSLSCSHIHQLKNKMSRLTKKGLSMDAYLTEFKTIADQLALACAPVDDEDIVLFILNGLPDEYNAFKTTICARSDSISPENLCSLLRSEEIHIESAHKHSHASEIPYAYAATTKSFSHRGGSNGSSGFRGNSSLKGGRYFRGSRRGGRQNFHTTSPLSTSFHSQTGSGSGSGLVCQICGKQNHTALDCWYRMDPGFQASARSTTPKAYVASTSQSQNCPNQNSPIPPTWYVDSAATFHVTNDLNQLSDYQPYQGTDQVTIGDGSTLPIHHIGQSYQENSI
ncbi:uncharacterized protein LOC114273489 isoform X2 [Camellia sinensis]|uniref:uncharacterized protein LOC114273489 isoform X2 n=1 Tax=Camellia sinensis TaxID=4442 RepID=UPI0010366451|nr:uncharacterized protein LOC114273489 isoform X2 [Camellia sinensis]